MWFHVSLRFNDSFCDRETFGHRTSRVVVVLRWECVSTLHMSTSRLWTVIVTSGGWCSSVVRSFGTHILPVTACYFHVMYLKNHANYLMVLFESYRQQVTPYFCIKTRFLSEVYSCFTVSEGDSEILLPTSQWEELIIRGWGRLARWRGASGVAMEVHKESIVCKRSLWG